MHVHADCLHSLVHDNFSDHSHAIFRLHDDVPCSKILGLKAQREGEAQSVPQREEKEGKEEQKAKSPEHDPREAKHLYDDLAALDEEHAQVERFGPGLGAGHDPADAGKLTDVVLNIFCVFSLQQKLNFY